MPLMVVTGGESFLPSGMAKNGTQKMSGSWADVPNWTADPGSTLSGNGLRVQGSTVSATITATLPFSGGSGTGPTQQARILVNNNIVGTGAQVVAASGTLIATATLALSDGDVVTVQAICTAQLAGWESTIAATGTVRIAQP